MIAPSGLGIWIAYEPQNAADRCVDIGAAWVAPRAGLNGWQKSSLSKDSLVRYKHRGLKVYPWIYPTMDGWKSSVAGFVDLWDTELCDGLIVDAEAEWCGPDRAFNALEADAFVQELRDRCPDAFIAHAPMDYLNYHPTFPWAQFGKLDAVMPQTYFFEHDDRGAAHNLEGVEAQWIAWEESNPSAKKPRWPIGCTYRPRQRLKQDLAPLPIERIVAEVAAFLDHPLVRAAAAPSLYSLEAAPPEVIAMLAERVRTREVPPTQPDTAPTDPYLVDRLESALESETKEAEAVPGSSEDRN